jgi:hypothetical protein
MSQATLEETKSKIQLLEEEIELLKQKKAQLKKLKRDYYEDYFTTPREEFCILKDIPDNPDQKEHILYDYSVLNVDTVGRMIGELMRKYEHKDIVAERIQKSDMWDNAFGGYHVYHPQFVIGERGRTYLSNRDFNNIVIDYEMYNTTKDFPTNNPVYWDVRDDLKPCRRSNYRRLISYENGLSFNEKNYEYIKELIFSLAYFQKQHDIHQMGAKDTWDVYRKIYKK